MTLSFVYLKVIKYIKKSVRYVLNMKILNDSLYFNLAKHIKMHMKYIKSYKNNSMIY